jgi:hypothetical protein
MNEKGGSPFILSSGKVGGGFTLSKKSTLSPSTGEGIDEKGASAFMLSRGG